MLCQNQMDFVGQTFKDKERRTDNQTDRRTETVANLKVRQSNQGRAEQSSASADPGNYRGVFVRSGQHNYTFTLSTRLSKGSSEKERNYSQNNKIREQLVVSPFLDPPPNHPPSSKMYPLSCQCDLRQALISFSYFSLALEVFCSFYGFPPVTRQVQRQFFFTILRG